MAKILPMTGPNLSGHFDIHSRDGCGTTLWHLWHPMALSWVPDTPSPQWTRARSGAETETVLRFSWLMFFYETRWAVGQRTLTGVCVGYIRYLTDALGGLWGELGGFFLGTDGCGSSLYGRHTATGQTLQLYSDTRGYCCSLPEEPHTAHGGLSSYTSPREQGWEELKIGFTPTVGWNMSTEDYKTKWENTQPFFIPIHSIWKW